MSEVCIGAHRVHFNAHFLEVGIFIGHVAQLCGAHESEVGRVKEKNRPFSFKIILGHRFESVVMVGLSLKVGHFGID